MGHSIFEAYNRTRMGYSRRYLWRGTFLATARLEGPQIVRGWRKFRLFYDQWSPHVYFLSSYTARIPRLILLSSNVTKLRFPVTTRNVTISSPHGPIAFLIHVTLLFSCLTTALLVLTLAVRLEQRHLTRRLSSVW